MKKTKIHPTVIRRKVGLMKRLAQKQFTDIGIIAKFLTDDVFSVIEAHEEEIRRLIGENRLLRERLKIPPQKRIPRFVFPTMAVTPIEILEMPIEVILPKAEELNSIDRSIRSRLIDTITEMDIVVEDYDRGGIQHKKLTTVGLLLQYLKKCGGGSYGTERHNMFYSISRRRGIGVQSISMLKRSLVHFRLCNVDGSLNEEFLPKK